MIKSENGQLHLQGNKNDLKLEYMQMLDGIKKSNLFSCKEEMESLTLFVLLDEKEQKECISEALDDMIVSLEKLMK